MDTGLYGQVKTVTDPNNAVVSTAYDALGRRTSVTQPDGFWTTTSPTTASAPWVVSMSGRFLPQSLHLDLLRWLGPHHHRKEHGNRFKTIVTHTEYDARGAVTRTSIPVFDPATPTLWSTNTYDPMGRVIRTDNPDGSRGLTCHDDFVSVSIDANDHKKRTVRDAYGRVVTVQEYTGTHTTCTTSAGSPYATTTYSYDVLGNLLTLTDAKGNVSTMTYDTLSRKTSMHDPDMGTWTYVYDANGNLTQQTDAKAQQIHFQYDALNRRVQKDYGTQKTLGSGDVVYTYDGSTNNRKGRLNNVLDGSGTATFFYDVTGRVTKTDKVIDSTTYTTQSSYDGLGRVTAITYPDTSTVTQTYNGPQLKEVKEGSTTYASYGGFNALGQPNTLTLGNGVATTYTYDAQNFRLKTLKTVKDSTTLQDLGYTFDTGGNVTGLTDTEHGNQTFGYDDIDRLTSATGNYGTITYTYNEIGNMLSNSQVGTYSYPASGSASVRPHAVSTAGSHTYTYDNNGNMISGAGRTITYDHENRPVSITKDAITTTFLYDGDGGRVKKTAGTDVTTYIGKLYVCDGTTAPLSCAKMVFAASQRLAMVQIDTGAISYFSPDHLGSTSVLTDATGTTEQQLAYYPYGDTRVNTGSGGSGSSIQVDEWWLYVGNTPGASDVYDSGSLGTALTDTVTNLPADGRLLDVTLWYKVNQAWQSEDYVYTAAGATGDLTSPSPGSTLSGASSTFTWTAPGQTVQEWWLYIGTTEGGNDLYDSGSLGVQETVTVTNLPTDGSRLYVELWAKVNGVWESDDYVVTASGGPGGGTAGVEMTSPSAGTVLPGSTATFTWNTAGSPGGGTTDVAYKYTGKEQDDSTGLYFYEARYYDPVLGRFIQPDTIVPDPLGPQTLNRYAYVLNNPLIYTDPSGNFACLGLCVTIVTIATKAAIGAAIGAAGNVALAAITGGDLGNAAISGAITGAVFGAGGFGVIQGAIAGAASAAATRGDPLRGAAFGAVAGGLLGLTSNLNIHFLPDSLGNSTFGTFTNEALKNALFGSALGAGFAAATGGNPGKGAINGAVNAAVSTAIAQGTEILNKRFQLSRRVSQYFQKLSNSLNADQGSTQFEGQLVAQASPMRPQQPGRVGGAIARTPGILNDRVNTNKFFEVFGNSASVEGDLASQLPVGTSKTAIISISPSGNVFGTFDLGKESINIYGTRRFRQAIQGTQPPNPELFIPKDIKP